MTSPDLDGGGRLRIAVIGSGISALSCAWLLSERHDVTVFERADRLGGHANTVTVRTAAGATDVDTGFIVFNDRTYPNLTALFRHLDIRTKESEMSFSVSRDGGRFEYAAPNLFAQRRNLINPRFWSMLGEIMRFYRQAPGDLAEIDDPRVTLGQYLRLRRFSAKLRDDHLLPMAAAIWSSPIANLMDYPAQSFIRFCGNHGLMQLRDRPVWRTVNGGSRTYVEKLALRLSDVRLGVEVRQVRRTGEGVVVQDAQGRKEVFDQVVIGAHADQALAMLSEPSQNEQRVLGAFRYSKNLAVLHTDESLMPRRRRAWASWNYLAERSAGAGETLCVSYWMNRLQSLDCQDVFVTLNPPRPPAQDRLLRSELYEHPIFDPAAITAQRELWRLQGRGGVWFCGAHFGAGFHEDGLQSGLAVAEQLGGVRRPWTVDGESDRIHLHPLLGGMETAA